MYSTVRKRTKWEENKSMETTYLVQAPTFAASVWLGVIFFLAHGNTNRQLLPRIWSLVLIPLQWQWRKQRGNYHNIILVQLHWVLRSNAALKHLTSMYQLHNVYKLSLFHGDSSKKLNLILLPSFFTPKRSNNFGALLFEINPRSTI